jgi:hypothetical protein
MRSIPCNFNGLSGLPLTDRYGRLRVSSSEIVKPMLTKRDDSDNANSSPTNGTLLNFFSRWPTALIGLGLTLTLVWMGLLVWFGLRLMRVF